MNRARYRRGPRSTDRTPVAEWLRGLHRAGLSPNLELLELFYDGSRRRVELNARERWRIGEYQAICQADLNVTDGDDGMDSATAQRAGRLGGYACRGRGKRQWKALVFSSVFSRRPSVAPPVRGAVR